MQIDVTGHTGWCRWTVGDARETRGDIDAVTHEVAVGLLHEVAEMHADAHDDAPDYLRSTA